MVGYTFYDLNPYKDTKYKDFYDKLFKEMNSYYIALGFPSLCQELCSKAIYMPWDFINILTTQSMLSANSKIQTAHSYKLNNRMFDMRYEHMCFSYILGVDLLIILERKGYQIDAVTKTAFLLKLLTHDIGHGPFSHPFEQMVDGYKGMHEDIGARCLLEESDINECLNKIYPGLAEFIVNFKEKDTSGLNELVEGIFDLDRAAFLIIDTWLSNSKVYKENSINELELLIKAIYNIFENIILRNGHVYYHPNCFFDLELFLKKRFYNYVNVYQEPGRTLDDLLLHEYGVELIKPQSSQPFFDDILKTVTNFKEFLAEIKRLKAQIDLKKYYEYEDNDLNRVVLLSKLYDNPQMSFYARQFLAPYSYMTAMFDTETIDSEDDYQEKITKNPKVLHSQIKIKVYSSTPDEHIIFYNPEDESYTDFQDMPARTLDITPYKKYYIYHEKESLPLKYEDSLRAYFKAYFYSNSKAALENCILATHYEKKASDLLILKKLIPLFEALTKGISLEEYAKINNITISQVYEMLSIYYHDELWSSYAYFLCLNSSQLGNFFVEIEFSKADEMKKYLEQVKNLLQSNVSLVDYEHYDSEKLFEKLCICIGSVVFINKAVLDSLDISLETREKIEKISGRKLVKNKDN